MSQSPHLEQQFNVNVAITPGNEPRWKALVDRWYQLDSVSFALSEAAFQLRPQIQGKFDFIFLAVQGGSNASDLEFIDSQYQSPAKFVYTLPNVAISALCQIFQWKGQTRCVVYRETELDSVHSEAMDLALFEHKTVALFLIDQLTTDSHKLVQFYFYTPQSSK